MSELRQDLSEMPVAAIAGITATVTVFAISQGLSYPLLSFILQRQGVSPGMIGLSAAMTPLGFIVSSLVVPALTNRFGAGRVAVACALTAGTLLGLIGWQQNIWLWFPLRFLLGFFANPLYVISETWLLAVTPAAKRGRIMGVYTSMISAGFAMGPLTLALVGTEGWPPFAVGVSAFALCAMSLVLVLPRLPDISGDHGTSVLAFARLAPLMLLAVFTAAAFEQVLMSLISVYGTAYGSAEERMSLLLTVFIAGNIALQIPFGAIAERIGALNMMLFCALCGLAGAFLLPLLFLTPLIWPLAFFWGAVAFGVYTMALLMLGERFSGSMLITGNSAFALFWGLGGIVGPPVTGSAMTQLGPQGLPLTLGLICTVLCTALIIARSRRPS
jgi:MFS family permease